MFEKIKSVFKPLPFSIVAIIVTGFLLRLYRLVELFHFTYDEEIIAFVGKRMWVNHHIPLIGGVTPLHVHLAPYFYWFSGLTLGLFNLNPLGWGIVAALIAAATMIVLWFSAKALFNKTIASFSVIFYAFSFYQNLFDRHYWGLAFNGLLSLLTIYCLKQIIDRKYRFTYLLSLVLAFGFHTDPSTIVLIIASIIVFFLKVRLPQKQFLMTLIIFGLSFVPLIAFDVRHNFVNISGINQYISEIKSQKPGVIHDTPISTLLFVPRALSRTLFVNKSPDLAQEYSYCPQYAVSRINQSNPLAQIFVLLVFSISLIAFFRTKDQQQKNSFFLLLVPIISVYVGISSYGLLLKGDLFDHYLSTLFPLFYVLFSFVLYQLLAKQKYILWLIVLGFVTLNLLQLQNVKHRFGFYDKEQAVRWAITQVNNQPFSLDVIGNCFRYNGYRYLFYLFGDEPEKSYVDANFTHLYDQPPAGEQPKTLVVIANPSDFEDSDYFEEYDHYEEKTIARKSFGAIEVLIVDNSNLDFLGKF
ncbi:hypothetical protein C4564_00770 [Candidatus Microgenomates bacterium]|nr:MAG: hypothetical protein C4564_00770 [Candidatus Microgenomates bacterium]